MLHIRLTFQIHSASLSTLPCALRDWSIRTGINRLPCPLALSVFCFACGCATLVLLELQTHAEHRLQTTKKYISTCYIKRDHELH